MSRSPKSKDLASPATNGVSEKPFMNYAHMFVKMFSRLATGQLVVGTIDETGTKFLVRLIDRDVRVWQASYDDHTLRNMRMQCHDGINWHNFFELLQRTFAEHLMEWDEPASTLKITLKHDRQSESLNFAPFVSSLTLNLEKTSIADFGKKMTESMISFVMLRTGDRKEMDRVVDVIRVDASLQAESKSLTSEVQQLDSSSAKLKAWVEDYDKNYASLAAELNNCSNKEVAAEWESVLGKANLERCVSRVDNPLRREDGTAEKSNLDMPLLQALKSETPRANYNNLHFYRYNNVVLPYTPEERDNYVGKLSPNAKALYTQLVEEVDQWELNVFTLQEKALQLGGNALIYLGYFILWRHNLPAALNLDEAKILAWLEMVSHGYMEQSNAAARFHTAVHAADVLHAFNYMVSSTDGVHRLGIKDPQLLGGFMAAMCHDFGHRGVNNTFHSNVSTSLSHLYADASAMENYHVAQVIELMKLPQYDLFDCTPTGLREDVERTMVELVLATDMKRHNFYMTAFEQLQGEKLHKHHLMTTLCMILKASDVSNCAKPPELYQKWAGAIMREYTTQTELEQKEKVAETQSLMTTTTSDEDRAKGQIGFMNLVVLPLFAAISDAVPTLRSAVGEYIAENKNYWADKLLQ